MTEQKSETSYEWMVVAYEDGGATDICGGSNSITMKGLRETMSLFEGVDPELKFQTQDMLWSAEQPKGYGHIDLIRWNYNARTDYVVRGYGCLEPIKDGSLRMEISGSDFKVPKRILKQIEKYNAGIKDKSVRGLNRSTKILRARDGGYNK